MKFMSRLFLIVLIAGAAYVVWQKYYAPKSDQPPAPDETVPLIPQQPDFSVRTWTNQSGRSFAGSLVSAKNNQVIIRRESDSLYFQIPATSLSAEDQQFVGKQTELASAVGGFSETVDGLYTLARKLEITGYIVRVPSSSLVGGWRNDRVNPMYWLLLSKKLHTPDSGSLWVRVDEKTFRAHEEGTFITRDNLINFSDGKGGFSESLEWSRSQLTLIEAQYGPNAQGINVTHKLLKIAARGDFPVEIQPELFDLLPHAPAAWELTVAWRTPTGEIRRTFRDGSVLTWP